MPATDRVNAIRATKRRFTLRRIATMQSPLAAVGRFLPQFDSVAFGILDPAEPAYALHLLDVADNGRPPLAQLGKHRVQVANSKIDHELLVGTAEVVGIGGEGRPDGWAGLLHPDPIRVFRVRVDAEGFAVP